ncbi:MAG TPA: glycosyltransferase family 2 protein [Rhodanobacteraceae bacterium]|nr:glycosyltransferase family 2 protein [Rhodanobacteraceae bacterium]
MTAMTVVAPAFNEAGVLPAFHARLAAVLEALPLDCRVLYVDDGSSDGSWDIIAGLAAADRRVTGLRLSRNFGKEAALTAGLDHVDATADAVVVIDSDLQDPPELIPRLVEEWRAGHDVVYATRSTRSGETAFKRFTAAAFYRLMARVSDTAIPRDTGDFRLLSRRALLALRQLPERQRFMKGLFAWIGFDQVGVHYQREARAGGRSKWNYWRLAQLAVEGLTSFSAAPLRLATWAGLTTSLLAFAFGVWVLVKALIWGDPVAGYPSLMIVILFLGGMQLLALGVIGEYIARTYAESKQRPLYYIEQQVGGPADTGGEAIQPPRVHARPAADA